jgi:hypothetical protein
MPLKPGTHFDEQRRPDLAQAVGWISLLPRQDISEPQLGNA